MILTFFTILGFIFGSFTNALVRRIHEGKKIYDGRSECPQCKSKLSLPDLVPVFSWLFLKGKCRHCGEKIGTRYLLVELVFGFFFCLTTYLLFPQNFSGNFMELIPFLIVLALVANFLILAIYDILFLEIIDGIAIWIGFLMLGLSFTEYGFVNPMDGLIGAAIVYCFFYAQILIPGTVHFLTEKMKIKERINGIWIMISSFVTFPFWMFFRLFFSEKTLAKCKIFKDDPESPEIPAWIGGGDLRFALVMGFTLGWKKTLVGLFASYLIGGIYSIAILISEKITGKEISHEVPFLPFLTAGTFVAIIWGEQILEFYMNNFFYV